MSVFAPNQLDGTNKVRVPYTHLASRGDVTLDDVQQAADDEDGAVVVDGPGSEPGGFMERGTGPRVDAVPGDALGADLRPIPGSREATGIVPGGTSDAAIDMPAEDVSAPPPEQPRQPDARIRGRLRIESRFNPNYRYTQEDFYGPRGPDIVSTDALGGNMYIPRAGELPMALYASYAQENQEQQARNDKALQDLLESSKVDKTADPYQPAFTKLVTEWENNFLSGIADQYAGNTAMAWKEIAKKGSEANKAWMDGHKALNALGQFVKFQWGDAEKYITDVMNGNIRTTPEQKQRAIDVYYGIGNLKADGTGGDFAKLAEETEALKRDMNMTKYYKERILPMAPEMYSKISKEPVFFRTPDGRRGMRQRTVTEARDGFFKQAGLSGNAEIGVDAAEFERFVRDVLPQVKEDVTTITASDVPDSTDGGGGSAAPSAQNIRASFRPYFNKDANTQIDPKAREGTLFFSRYQTTGDKEHRAKQISVSDGKGPANTEMRDWDLAYNPARGGFYIIGTSLDETGKKLLKGITDKATDTQYDEVERENVQRQVEEIWQKYKRIVAVPASANADVVKTYYGDNDPYVATAAIAGIEPAEYRRKLGTEAGRKEIARALGIPVDGGGAPQAAASSAPKFVIDKGYTQADWDALSEKQRQAIVKAGKL